jgi:sulfatase maturation enzyme AslB (radical SAM superfamily)
MKTKEVLQAWGYTLSGRRPNLSIEITRECPLRCPGCYAYEEQHLGGNGLLLRTLADHKGDDLVTRVLEVVDRIKPLHLSIVGGDPLVRYREVTQLVPLLTGKPRGIHVQVVTSAFRVLPAEWATTEKMNVVVSIDGLQPEHDVRRKPATYERILKNIVGQHVCVHCTITAQMMQRPGYLEEFLAFWQEQPAARKVWFSIFTPQKGATDPEILSRVERERVVFELLALRKIYSKLDMQPSVIENFLTPPVGPEKCIFAQTTQTISADLKTRVGPCQFGGSPDCSQCGCIASVGLAAVGDYKVIGPITAGKLFHISNKIGKTLSGAA